MTAVSAELTKICMSGAAKAKTSAEITRLNAVLMAKGFLCAAADPFFISRAVVLGDEGRIGVSKVLNRKICEGVDLYCRRESRHGGGAKAVYKPLHHEDSEVHNRPLQAGSERKGLRSPL